MLKTSTIININKYNIIYSILLIILYPIFAWVVFSISTIGGQNNIFSLWFPIGLGLLYFLLTKSQKINIFLLFFIATLTNIYIFKHPLVIAILITFFTTLSCWISYRLIQPLVGEDIFDSVDLTQKYLIYMIIGATIASVFENCLLYFFGAMPFDHLAQNTIGFLAGNFSGMVILSSFYLFYASKNFKRKFSQLKEPFFWLNTLLSTIFTLFLLTTTYLHRVEFFILIPLLVILLRYREVGIHINGIILFSVGIYAIVLQNGALQDHSAYSVIQMQIFIFFVYAAGYSLSATLNQGDSLLHNQEKANEETLITFANFIEEKDAYTAGHSRRVAQYAREIAKQMGLKKDEIELVYKAGLIHDIGKIITPENVLLKPSDLSDEEYELMKQHAGVGSDMISKISHFKPHAKIVRHHHEWFNGNGYPDGLKGPDIPLLSRILCIADAFDAMTTNRIYKPRKSIKEAIEELDLMSKKQFDPTIVFYAKRYFQTLKKFDAYEQDVTSFSDEAEAKRFAYFFKDNLTGLFNKDYFHIILNQKAQKLHFKILYVICIKGMSAYNKEYGWLGGDELLRSFSQFLERKFPNSLIFRAYGDDFLILQKTHTLISEADFASFWPVKNAKVSVEVTKIDLEKKPLKTMHELEAYLFHSLKKPHNNPYM